MRIINFLKKNVLPFFIVVTTIGLVIYMTHREGFNNINRSNGDPCFRYKLNAKCDIDFNKKKGKYKCPLDYPNYSDKFCQCYKCDKNNETYDKISHTCWGLRNGIKYSYRPTKFKELNCVAT